MKTQIEVLSDDAIDAVSGGLTCEDALVVGQAYQAIGKMFWNAGIPVQALDYTSYGAGVTAGGCKPSGK